MDADVGIISDLMAVEEKIIDLTWWFGEDVKTITQNLLIN